MIIVISWIGYNYGGEWGDQEGFWATVGIIAISRGNSQAHRVGPQNFVQSRIQRAYELPTGLLVHAQSRGSIPPGSGYFHWRVAL